MNYKLCIEYCWTEETCCQHVELLLETVGDDLGEMKAIAAHN